MDAKTTCKETHGNTDEAPKIFPSETEENQIGSSNTPNDDEE